jgi:hypothetical protein
MVTPHTSGTPGTGGRSSQKRKDDRIPGKILRELATAVWDPSCNTHVKLISIEEVGRTPSVPAKHGLFARVIDPNLNVATAGQKALNHRNLIH